ncbi:SRPBCC domain-containing protein [Plantactinospora endophytica]|uniref:SRPBCC domain-containing protein n=1 Tax=Plantactinospora endophytica TaxID=673535 RepID=UPI0019433323|nr:SRPBCC domain-containing protein [Plantactinospora endophytica]
MRGFEASTLIKADPDTIWSVLTDGAAWPTWDSAVARFEGTIAPGRKVTVYPEVNPNRGFPVKVVDFQPAREMTWRGGMPLGLFTGTRSYKLTPQSDGTVRFDMREEYTGPLAGLIFKSVPDLNPSFRTFADGLKHRAEERAS